jgi:hypothetical protein
MIALFGFQSVWAAAAPGIICPWTNPVDRPTDLGYHRSWLASRVRSIPGRFTARSTVVTIARPASGAAATQHSSCEETAQKKARRIFAEKLKRRGCDADEVGRRRKGDNERSIYYEQ